jgi:hypothetical protein
MAHHELKVWPYYFDAIEDCEKPFEVRKNDRDFQPRDILWLREWDERAGYSGRDVFVRVTYVYKPTDAHPFPGGIEPGWCVMGIEVL